MRTAATITTVAAVVVALSACNGASNPTEEANRSLKQAHLNDVSLDWDGSARVAHLKGTVEQPTDRQRAEEIAAAAVGTTGRVLNEVTVKGINEQSAGNLDGDIKDQLKSMVDNDPALRDRSITFEVHNGAVLVKGDVQTAAEKAKLTEIVRSAPGVKDFANAVQIKPPKR
jgi:osmotically-inducible protein OsmY